MSHVAPDAVKTLLAGAIDYAGLFPPASLPMREAVANYANYRVRPNAWALGRFIVPAARLEEFGATLAGHPDEEPWRLSALMGADMAADLAAVTAFNQRRNAHGHGGAIAKTGATPRAVIDTLEFKAATASSISEGLHLADGPFTTFHEIPLGRETRALLATLSRAGARAKVRTGGVTADAFPAPAALASFLESCAAAGVPFKATAGLHHPLRGAHELTYESDSPTATMHGFVNVFLAAAFARTGWTAVQLAEVLNETSSTAIALTADGASWRGNHLDPVALHAARANFLISFGSCSFEEPIHDLQTLGWL
jgi:hypothetical protein